MSNLFTNLIRKTLPLNAQQIRWLPRWSHRQPVRVIPADQYDEDNDRQIRATKEEPHISTKRNWKQPKPGTVHVDNEKLSVKPLQYKLKTQKTAVPLTISSKNSKRTSKNETVDMLEATIDADGNFIYTKMRDNDSRVGTILVEVKSKKEKGKKDLILLEGKRLIKDALDAGCKLEYILFSRIKDVEYIRQSLPKLGAKLYKMPYKEMQMWSDLTTNPGIMGIFKIPDTESSKPSKKTLPLTVICDNIREPNNLGAILRTCSGVGCEKVILTAGCVNVWDSKVLRSACGAHFKLQILKKLSWDNIRENIFPDSSIYIADNSTVTSSSDKDSESQSLAELIQTVPVLPYYGADFKISNQIVVIIGGETEGISEDSYKFASESQGVRLNVPLTNGVESLNAGTALGIIVFEVKRQLYKT